MQCMVDGWMIVMNGNGDTWFVRSCERVMERRCRIERMHACMDGLTVVSVCVCVSVCGWLVRSTCCRVEQSTLEVMEKEPLRIAILLQIMLLVHTV